MSEPCMEKPREKGSMMDDDAESDIFNIEGNERNRHIR